MGIIQLLYLGALVTSILASPLSSDSPISIIQLPTTLTPNIELFNTTANLTTTLDAKFKGKCFPQKPPGEPQWLPTNIRDCGNAIDQLRNLGHDINRPSIFTPLPEHGVIQLPKTFISRDCAFLIDFKTPASTGGKDQTFEILTIKGVMDAAWSLAYACVAVPGPKIGGNGYLGDKGLVTISVYGVRGIGVDVG